MRQAAERLYNAGARIPDPPAPTMSVVSNAACLAAAKAWFGVWGIGDSETLNSTELSGYTAMLRAAWPFLVRDSLAALPRDKYGNAMWTDAQYGGHHCLRESALADLARALGAAPEGT